MTQERARASKDPLGDFGITDKFPLAVYTGGPLKVTMGVARQPIELVADAELPYGPTLKLQLDRNWFEGDLFEVAKVTVTMPPGLEIHDVNAWSVEGLCKVNEQREQVCDLEGPILKQLFPKEKPDQPITLPAKPRVHTRIVDIPTVLADAALAIRSFKVDVEYTYRLKREATVTVTPLKRPEAKKVPKEVPT